MWRKKILQFKRYRIFPRGYFFARPVGLIIIRDVAAAICSAFCFIHPFKTFIGLFMNSTNKSLKIDKKIRGFILFFIVMKIKRKLRT